MTIEEVMIIFEAFLDNPLFSEKHKDALTMIISLLEAWEKIKEEISSCFNAWNFDDNEFAMGKCSAFADCLEIINKYMQEVEK